MLPLQDAYTRSKVKTEMPGRGTAKSPAERNLKMRIRCKGEEVWLEDLEPKTQKATEVEMWYDRSRREWVIYTVDENGYQISEAVYGFTKKEAVEIRKAIKEECGIA